ncbi:MAG TPA: FAD-dependent oxidoreductase [Candidatus Elarobacter sp.]|jgi:2-polyprenyl-6-methoxyphenol hydroxylase-like FAD-dependent oxidoreductase|nr:FAD-dependent oxidoreductase [Candidatus Elarobacter sp.]
MSAMETGCCIAGGGPAGMMLGYLLARAGIDVVVLEKHADFLRDFRGDTVHPSTLDVIAELGLLDAFLQRPHNEVAQVGGVISGTPVTVGDFAHLPTRCKFIALMPQWDFLNFLAEHGKRYPTFHLRMQAEVTGLIEEGGRVAGVRATSPDGPLDVRARLVVGADGRHSDVRARAGLAVQDLGAPIDVLWMRLPRHEGDERAVLGRFDAGHILVMLDRGDYWQCAYVIAKGGFDDLKARGLDALRDALAAVAPELRDRVGDLHSWDDVKLLTVTIDRLRTWHKPGLLCIGDAAHAMSPIGGVGINLAIQDAVATANLLWQPLRDGTPTDADLARVQRRRWFPMQVTQAAQVFVQNHVISGVLGSTKAFTMPWPLRLLQRFPYLRRFPARAVGVGVRPEHVHTPEVTPAAD